MHFKTVLNKTKYLSYIKKSMFQFGFKTEYFVQGFQVFINSSLHAVIFLTLHRKSTRDIKSVFTRPDIQLTFVKMKSITFGDDTSN